MTGLATDYYTKYYMGRLWERDRDQLRTAENREAIRIRARFEPDQANLSSVGWSGARDLNPGAHGPEPCVPRVLLCPDVSSSVPVYSIRLPVMSSRVLSCPPG